MPFFERDGEFGDLFVEFNVVLPAALTPETRTSTSSIFHFPRPILTLTFLQS